MSTKMPNFNENLADKKFLDYHVKLRASLSEQQLRDFETLSCNRERIVFVANLPNRPDFTINVRKNHGKNLQEARTLKDRGNACFQKENFEMALSFYSKALLKSSENLSEFAEDLPIYYANRSAALYHLKKYNLSIKDADFSLKLGYPQQLKYKILDRKARCYLALEDYQLAETIFKQTISALDDAKLALEKRQKWQKDIQIMLAMMLKNKPRAPKAGHNDKKKYLGVPKIKGKRDSKYDSLSAMVEIQYNEELGRHAVAKNEIKVGETVLIEEPHCAVLLSDYQNTNCHICFNRVEVIYPCPTCDQVIFCSEVCVRKAVSSFHGVECSILSSLWESAISITCLMALRIITQEKLAFFLNKRSTIFDVPNKKHLTLNSSQYESVHNLLTHESKRKSDDLFNRALMAAYLLECLKKTSYFDDSSCTRLSTGLNDDEIYIGELLLHHLQVVQFNAHEVSEVQIPNDNVEKSSSECIGAALYPTLALFNHSCNPAVIRYFQGTRVIAVTVRNVRTGEMVAENYGPLFQETEREERRRILNRQYWFLCNCDACTLNWPTLSEMVDLQDIRFRCSNKKCNNAMYIDVNANNFMVKCNVCLQNVNMLKPLKALQESDEKFAMAKSYMRIDKIKKALEEFLKLMNQLDEYLAPPYKDYHLCQQAIRTCFLLMGNIYKYNSN